MPFVVHFYYPVSIRARHLDAERLACTIRQQTKRTVSIRARHLDAERPYGAVRKAKEQVFQSAPGT
mgnify:CR=1 FL=1